MNEPNIPVGTPPVSEQWKFHGSPLVFSVITHKQAIEKYPTDYLNATKKEIRQVFDLKTGHPIMKVLSDPLHTEILPVGSHFKDFFSLSTARLPS
jgi:hypothetical protein